MGLKKREKAVFEGAAIMLYLCQKYDKNHKISYPFDTDKCVSLPHSPIFLKQCNSSCKCVYSGYERRRQEQSKMNNKC